MRSPAQLPQPAENTHLLEITLISAQGLKTPAAAVTLRRLKTYAYVWIDPNTKLKTQIDSTGAQNPTWNDKFIFRVTSDFLAGDTSAVTVDIFAVGVLNHLLGSVRLLLSNVLSPSSEIGAPAFAAVQIRRPSGRFHGILNIGATVIDGCGLEFLAGVSAIGYRDLMGLNPRVKKHRRGISDVSSGSESCGGDSVDFSDGAESTESTTSSSSASTVLKEPNGFGQKEMAGKKGVILCGPGFLNKVQISRSDQDIQALGSLDLKRS
uniref:C2 domain-containing protein n=1 Tax=Opuntia streptacantha TaxID=393608 RepID=A0A7C9CM70_OPUST